MEISIYGRSSQQDCEVYVLKPLYIIDDILVYIKVFSCYYTSMLIVHSIIIVIRVCYDGS
jgi:hypothetical protein